MVIPLTKVKVKKCSPSARQFAGLNFNDKRAAEGIEYAHVRGMAKHSPVEVGKETLYQLIKGLKQQGLELPAEVFA